MFKNNGRNKHDNRLLLLLWLLIIRFFFLFFFIIIFYNYGISIGYSKSLITWWLFWLFPMMTLELTVNLGNNWWIWYLGWWKSKRNWGIGIIIKVEKSCLGLYVWWWEVLLWIFRIASSKWVVWHIVLSFFMKKNIFLKKKNKNNLL